MGENLFCAGQKSVSMSYRDGHTRAFRGYPEMSDAVKKLLGSYRDKKQYNKIMMFFTGICEFDVEYSGFLTRELIRGNL